MNEKQIRSLIKLVEESNIGSLEVSSWGRTIKIIGRGAVAPEGNNGMPFAPLPVAAVVPPPAVSSAEPEAPQADTSNLVEIKSPMVGTFYAAPSPETPLYVSLNERITEGQVVCIVEAMKLMNEIEAEVSGRIAEICVQNAQPVEFGQVLFKVDPTG